MDKKSNGGLLNIGAVLRAANTAAPKPNDVVDPVSHKRQLLADLCRLLEPRPAARSVPSGAIVGTAPGPQIPNLSPRMRQTLERLLQGDSEKQIASQLGVSRNTVHVYVKALYKSFGVCSRGELLARFVRQPRL